MMAEQDFPENENASHETPPQHGGGERNELPSDPPAAEADDASDVIDVGHESGASDQESEATESSSSAIQIGTGQSGIVSEDWSLPGEVDDVAGDDGEELPSAGAFEIPEGLVPDLEADFGSVDAAAADDQSADGEELGSEFSEFADIDNPEMAADLIGETSQDELPGSWDESDDIPDVGEGSADHDDTKAFGSVESRRGSPAGGLRPRQFRKKQSAGSVVGVIVGGLMAVPIVLVILLWGFRRDDFGLVKMLPENLSFLVPAELQRPQRPRLPRLPELPEGQTLPPMPVLPAVIGESVDVLPQTPIDDPLLSAADLALVEMATARANVMLGSVLELPPDAPETMQKTALVDWYKSLAAVGEEAVAAEQRLVEEGRSTDGIDQSIARTTGRIAENTEASEQLKELARQWLQASKRDSQGVVLPGVVGDVERVGAIWSVTLQTGEGEQSLSTTVLCRQPLQASAGSRVVAVGVVISETVVWAAAWGGLEADADLTTTPSDPLSDPPVTEE
ncbi:MAG: hypothetical protein ISQ07_04465 [Pirellulales bacterium]|jgi:hypothetical protein|nr:hypothetical protein [Pirellulales bacterium]